MTGRSSLVSSCGYVVTEAGIEAAEAAESCPCEDEVQNCGVFQCPQCSEVHDVVKGWFATRQRTWEKARWY